MTELAEHPTGRRPAVCYRSPLVWRYFGDNRMFLHWPTAFRLQNMLAELGRLLDHSVFFADPAARVNCPTADLLDGLNAPTMTTPPQYATSTHNIKGGFPANMVAAAISPSIPHLLLGPTPRSSTSSYFATRSASLSPEDRGIGGGGDLPLVQYLVISATESATGRCPRLIADFERYLGP